MTIKHVNERRSRPVPSTASSARSGHAGPHGASSVTRAIHDLPREKRAFQIELRLKARSMLPLSPSFADGRERDFV